MTTPARWRKL